jgi:hypothetical protein
MLEEQVKIVEALQFNKLRSTTAFGCHAKYYLTLEGKTIFGTRV